MATTYDTERQLQRDISRRVEAALPGVEVLAVELQSPSRFCVYIDHAEGVDHALCGRVTNVIRDYSDRYTIDVRRRAWSARCASPATSATPSAARLLCARPSRSPAASRSAASSSRPARRRSRSQPDRTPFDIPYEAVVRGNLIDEVTTK